MSGTTVSFAPFYCGKRLIARESTSIELPLEIGYITIYQVINYTSKYINTYACKISFHIPR